MKTLDETIRSSNHASLLATRRITKPTISLIAIALLAVSVLPILAPAVKADVSSPVAGSDVLYTLDADFDKGVLVNVNHNAPNNNQLQITIPPKANFPFVNIAASARGTIIRINVTSGAVVGEYFTAPNGMGRNPSRTTVDLKGSVWVNNRDESGYVNGVPMGAVVRVGLIVGGTRTDAAGNPDPNGAFVKNPIYTTCVDRDGDGLFKTSRGLGDIRPWTNAGGADTFGGVSTADDECIINYTRVNGYGNTPGSSPPGGGHGGTVAIDKNNDVWVGGLSNQAHEKLSGITGQPVPDTQFNLGCGGYGGLIDNRGILWSARGGGNLLRFNTTSMTGNCLTNVPGGYGLGIDPVTHHIWHTAFCCNTVYELDPNGALLHSYAHGTSYAQGVAVDDKGNVWVASSLAGGTTLDHIKTDGTFIGSVPVGNGPTGVAVDSAGDVWVANYYSSNAMRIDPSAGPIGADGVTHVGAVITTVDLGSGATPYNYSDMTGFVSVGVTAPQGTWTVVQDSGQPGTRWGIIRWNTEPQGSQPPGTSINVTARASDTVGGLGGQEFTQVNNGVQFFFPGRFIQAQVTMKADPATGHSPVLSDIRITAESIKVSKFFTDSSLNPLSLDSKGNPKVDVILNNGVVKSTNPGQVLAWVNVTNMGPLAIQSVKVNETLPVDWQVNPAWLPGKGAIHVFYANTTKLSTNPEITDPSTISVTSSNPEVVHLAIPKLNTTIIGHPLLPGQSILLVVKLSYGLAGTSQSLTSYPRNYTDTALAAAWTQESYTGAQASNSATAFFTAYAKDSEILTKT